MLGFLPSWDGMHDDRAGVPALSCFQGLFMVPL